MRRRAREALAKASRDKGLILMNVGAVASLSGFCMTDVLSLRMLNICGSLCGMAYNLTRCVPPTTPLSYEKLRIGRCGFGTGLQSW
jgi:hypothetical protein